MSHPGHRTEVCQCGEVIQYGTEPRVQVCITCPKCENAVASVVVDGDTARVQDVSFTIPSGLMRDVMVALLLARAETAEAGLAEYKAECARWKAAHDRDNEMRAAGGKHVCPECGEPRRAD
jgi:hypothetical protein